MFSAMRRATAVVVGAAVLLALVGALAWASPGTGRGQPVALAALRLSGTADSAQPAIDIDNLERHGDRLWAPLPEGARAELTLDPALQTHLERLFERYEVPYGAVIALEPKSGRVLAYVSHSSANPDAGDLVLDPTPPAASVFKVVTAAALLDRGVPASTRACYSGGLRGISASDLEDRPRDRACATLSEAMGGSINTVFAKLADRHLTPAVLTRYADAFGFGQALPFDLPTRPSPTEVPAQRLEFARTAAGFWHMHMSPLHAALIGATVANGGVMPRLGLVERVLDADGASVRRFEPSAYRPVVPASTARVLTSMMTRTVSHGTARSAFFDQKGLPFLPGVSVAGKTGSLSTSAPYRAYSWFVGFAPAKSPRMAVAALVVNTPKWRIKGSYVGREALRHYLMRKPTPANKPHLSEAKGPVQSRTARGPATR